MMGEWKECKLKDVVSVQRGYDLPAGNRQSGDVPVIGSHGLTGYHNVAKAKGPGVTIGRSGASIGFVTYVPRSFWPHNATLFVTDFHNNDKRFVYYFLKCIDFKTFNSGSAQPSLNRNFIYEIPVTVPDFGTQQRIASILSTYDDLVENNTRRIAILEEMVRRIYNEWFVNFRFPGHEKVKMVDSELGPIPSGWEVKSLSEVSSITMGQSPKSEFYNDTGDGLPFHQGVRDYGAHFPVDRLYCTVQNRVAEDGDILFSVRAPVGRINLATTKIVIGRGLSAIRSKQGAQTFLFCQLLNKFSEEDIIGGGTIFKAVTKKDMHDIKMLQPVRDLIEAFESHAKPIWKVVRTLTDKNNNLRQTRDLLLPKLISGEIDVSELQEATAAA